MGAAGVVRVGRSDDACQTLLAVVRDDHLAVVGFEIRQSSPGAERDGPVVLIERVGQPSRAPAAAVPPTDPEPPQPGVDGIRIPQAIEVRHHDVHACAAQQLQISGGIASVDVVDRVGDEQHPQVRMGLPLCDQCVAQLTGERA